MIRPIRNHKCRGLFSIIISFQSEAVTRKLRSPPSISSAPAESNSAGAGFFRGIISYGKSMPGTLHRYQ